MRPDKEAARTAGIPKAFQRYNAHYGKGITHMLQEHRKCPEPMLDHGRDRQTKKLGVAPLPERAPIEGVALAS